MRSHHISCACVSGVILFSDYFVFHDLHDVMTMFAFCKLNTLMSIIWIKHTIYYHTLCVFSTLCYLLCTHSAHSYIDFLVSHIIDIVYT